MGIKRVVRNKVGGGISFQTLLIDPFFNGHQFVLNMPMWFIAPLFFAEMINVLIRAATKSIPSSLKKEIFHFLFRVMPSCQVSLLPKHVGDGETSLIKKLMEVQLI